MNINEQNRMREIAGLPLMEARTTARGDWVVHKDGKLIKRYKTREGAKAAIAKAGPASGYDIASIEYFQDSIQKSGKAVKESSKLTESIADTYNVGVAIEFFLSMFDDMYEDPDMADAANAETITETSVQEYLRDMINDELEQALLDPEVKRRILEVVGRARQGVSGPDQGTLPV